MVEINHESTIMYIANRREISKLNRYRPVYLGLIGLKSAIADLQILNVVSREINGSF